MNNSKAVKEGRICWKWVVKGIGIKIKMIGLTNMARAEPFVVWDNFIFVHIPTYYQLWVSGRARVNLRSIWV